MLLLFLASQETQTSVRAGKFSGLAPESPLKLTTWVYTLINDNFRWSKSSITVILIHIFSGLNLLKTRPWLNQERKVIIYNRRSCRLVTDKTKSREQFWPIARTDFFSERRLLIIYISYHIVRSLNFVLCSTMICEYRLATKYVQNTA